MTQGDGPAIDVHFLLLQPGLPDNSECLGREGLIQFDQVDLIQRQTGLFQRQGYGRNRTDPHDPRMHAGDGTSHQSSDRRQAKFLHFPLAHDHYEAAPSDV